MRHVVIRRWAFCLPIALLVAAWFLANCPLAARGAPVPQLPPPPVPFDFPRPPAKIDSALYKLWRTAQSGDTIALPAQGMALLASGEQVQVEVQAQEGQFDAALAVILAHGGTLQTSYGNWLQAMVPAGELLALANEDAVASMRRPSRLEPQAVTSEGFSVVGASAWQQVGFTGQGIKIGIIDSFKGYQALMGSELPPASQLVYNNFSSTPGRSKHGTAVAEIIYDLAPAAQLYLAEANTGVEVANAVDWLIQQAVDIINVSGGNPAWGPGDGTGFAGSLVDKAAAQDILWVNVVGNYGVSHWSGSWNDPDDDLLQNFLGADQSNTISASAGQIINIVLKWDDPWGGSCNDYALVLSYNDPAAGAVSGISDDRQQCGQYDIPIEGIQFLAPVSTEYHIAIKRNAGASPRNLHLFALNFELQYKVTAGSVSPPADNRNALAVGAVPMSSLNTIEPFSSQGPTKDGRIKPDLVAPDRVTTATYGSQGFPGTSAAAPHVAGIAALVRQANPQFSIQDVRRFLEARATDLGAAGKDNVFGAGRISAGSPPAAPTPTPTPPSPRIATQLGHCLAKVFAVFGWDNEAKQWLAYSPDVPPFANNLLEMVRGRGYWIMVRESCALTTGGVQIPLFPGANLIGWLD